MNENTYYRQCVLRKDSSVQTAWIPEYLAKVGKPVWIKDETRPRGRDYGWRVSEVGARRNEVEVREHEQDHKKHRKNSDATRDKDGRWKKVE